MNDTERARDGLGRAAYIAYREGSGGVSLISGDPLPAWEKLGTRLQSAWEASASQVRTIVLDALVDAVEKATD